MLDNVTLVIGELSLAAVDVNSAYFNFGEEFGVTWDEVTLGLLQCESCPATFDDDAHGEGDPHYHEGDPCPICPHTLQRPEVAPMMNYYYELPYYEGDPEEDQLTLYQSSANVVLVRMLNIKDNGDSYALALSGGGMDLSWDICHAYILLGYAPPLHFCDLPDFGQDNSQEPYNLILKACLQSAKFVAERATRKIEQLQSAMEINKEGQ